ncbi:hypothetical protein QAD02_015279 [Eretmocerus hayati]|uniref:Uncharacterized protein n=1 Tax=Eretmocerus hayati TaxID=131215 RepID=A0ACC2P878_9HYME|nr:hypothetical protein QAD02_015279 [Eretmocerus hayati]
MPYILVRAADIEQLSRFASGGYCDDSTIVYLQHPCVILTALEVLGYKVVASSSTSVKQDYNEYMWTMRKDFSEPEPEPVIKAVHGSQITAFCKFCDQSYIQNATRMEKHIERCTKCPEDVRQDFMQLVRNKRAKSLITMRLAENWSSIQATPLMQGESYNESSINAPEWDYRDAFHRQGSDNLPNNTSVDSKSWARNLPLGDNQPEETATNQEWEATEQSRETEDGTDEVEDSGEEPTFSQRSCRNGQYPHLPLSPGRPSADPILQHKIQNEQYLERRALRQIAELDLRRKTLELEKFQWEFQVEKTQNEMRWAHECRMMQLQEEHQRQIIDQGRPRSLDPQTNGLCQS